MKKRFLPALCAVALLLSVTLLSAQGAEYDDIYFMAVNMTIYPATTLSDDSMPVVSGGVLYVPYTMFDTSYTGVELEVYYNYSRQLGTFTMYDRQRMVVFDINSGTCYDRDTKYSAHVIARNGKIYIPVVFVCELFDLTCSTFPVKLSTGTVNMVRVSSGTITMDDAKFASAATFLMTQPLADYLRSKMTPPPTIAPITTPPPIPTATNPPGITPGITSPPGVTSQPDTHEGTVVRLAFRCTDGEGLPAIIRSLDANGLSAAFYFRPQDLTERDGDVRDLLAHGHQIGLLLDPKTAASDFEQGNALLSHIARLNTRSVIFPPRKSADGPWTLWRDNTGEVMTRAVGSSAITRVALQALSEKTGSARLTLDDSSATANALPPLFAGLARDKYVVAYR